jgi:hypothetical protein
MVFWIGWAIVTQRSTLPATDAEAPPAAQGGGTASPPAEPGVTAGAEADAAP